MAHTALYRKYRPVKLDEVIGQPQVVDVLSQALSTNNIAHAYLFTGQRGTGKTTVARILAHLINGSPYSIDTSDDVDIIEIDAASNNGVDDVRDIRDTAQLAPMVGKYKIYIIDEFHMLSRAAFNALLKIIEEPPQHIVFILATTELQKVPATILSRVQRFQFRPINQSTLVDHLAKIAKAEKIAIDDKSLQLVARAGGGSVRDSITLLDQLSSAGTITVDYISSILGWASPDDIDQLIDYVVSGETSQTATAIRNLLDRGLTADALAKQIIDQLMMRTSEAPGLFRLIDDLLQVGKYLASDIKLMAVLMNFAIHQGGDDAGIVAPIVQKTPAPKKAKAEPVVAPKANQPVKSQKAEAEPDSIPAPDPKTSPDPQPKPVSKPAPAVDDGVADEFDWSEMLRMANELDLPSISALLSQADYRFNKQKNTLTLYFEREFHRKQASGNLFNSDIIRVAREVGGDTIVVEISKTSAPINSDVAAVLNIVGGEVTKYNG